MENETGKKRRILAWTLIPLAAIGTGAAIILLSTPIDLTRYSGRIESAIEARVNGDVELGSILLKALPAPEITLTGIEARHEDRTLFSADRLYARLRLFPLLTGSASFEAIEAKNPALFLLRDREGNLNLNEFLKKQPAEASSTPEKNGTVSIDSLNVEGGLFDFVDRFPMQTAFFSLTGIKASSTMTGRGTGFTATATLEPSTPVSMYGLVDGAVIEGQALIENLSLSAFNQYIRPPSARVKGLLDLDLSYRFDKVLVTKGSIEYRGLEASYPSTWEKPLVSPSGSGQMTLKTARGLFDLAVDDIVINMKGFSAMGSLRLVGPKNQKVMDLKASSTPVDADDFLDLLPTRKMSPPVAKRVRAIKPDGGTVTVKDLHLAGKVREMKGAGLLKNPDISARLFVNNASFTYNDFQHPFTNVSGGLEFKGGALKFSGLTGRYSRQTVESLSGYIKDLSGDGAFDLEAKGSLDVRESLGMAAMNATGTLKESLSAIDADGFATINARVSGSLKRPSQLRYSGSTVLSNGSAYYRGLPIGFESIDAAVDFNNDRLTVKDARVRTDSSSIHLTGSIDNYKGEDRHFKFQSEGSLTAETLSKAIGKGPGEINIAGSVPFTLSAEGRRDDFHAKASADATGAGLFIDKFLDKAPGFAMKAEAQGSLKGQFATVESATVSFGSSNITGSGTKKLGAPDFSVSAASERVLIADIDSLSQRLGGRDLSSGTLAFDVKAVKGPGQESALYAGRVSVSDGSFSTGVIANPIRNANARAEFDGNSGTLIIDRLETGSTVLTGRVNVLDMTGRVLRFDLDFPRLHAEDLLPVKREEETATASWLDEEELEDKEPKKKKPITGYGSIRAAEGDLWRHEFTSLSADARISADTIVIEPVSLDIDGGKATGAATIFLNDGDPRVFIADVNASGILLERLTSARTARKVLNGTARARISLVGMKGDGPLMRRLNGKASVVVKGGRLWKFGFITDIFSFVNIISLDELFKKGLPYKDITGEFTMDRGIISTSELTFDSDSLRMSGIGTLRLPENEIDLTLALHPFVTIDKIISNIPLLGWIITGKEESTVSFYFDVQGPAADPDITPLPVKTIEKSVFGILERLLKAPFRLFK